MTVIAGISSHAVLIVALILGLQWTLERRPWSAMLLGGSPGSYALK